MPTANGQTCTGYANARRLLPVISLAWSRLVFQARMMDMDAYHHQQHRLHAAQQSSQVPPQSSSFYSPYPPPSQEPRAPSMGPFSSSGTFTNMYPPGPPYSNSLSGSASGSASNSASSSQYSGSVHSSPEGGSFLEDLGYSQPTSMAAAATSGTFPRLLLFVAQPTHVWIQRRRSRPGEEMRFSTTVTIPPIIVMRTVQDITAKSKSAFLQTVGAATLLMATVTAVVCELPITVLPLCPHCRRRQRRLFLRQSLHR